MDRFTIFLFFSVGISLIFMDEYSFRGVTIKIEEYPIIRLFGLLISIFSLYIFFKIKRTSIKEKYTKCPKCKEVFNYQELKKGKCKYCEDIETIEIEEYYKKLSKENEDDK